MGCEHATISGDPAAEGKPFVLRIRCPDGAKVPPHWHPTDENITVLQGSFNIGTGEVFDASKVTPMDVGSFFLMPSNMRHFAICKGETTIQVHGVGPFKINWVNPAEVVPTKPKS
jgi:quercetin dioxygenase-like cupin family protein